MNEKKLTFYIAFFSFIILNTLICFIFFKTKYISKDIFRLHVIANSNSISDQITKLKVESKIKDYIASLKVNSKEDLINKLYANKDNILDIANSTLNENNLNYSAKLQIGKLNYDKKDNMLINMPSGIYDSANIILGDGNGKNIWSIIFPNEKTLDKLSKLDSILPGIKTIYSDNNEDCNKVIKSIIFKNLEINKY